MPTTDPVHPAQATVLVVDDTKENLTVIGQLLRPYFHVRVANSGQRALQVVETTPQPDLILLDVMMPQMNGHQVLEALRAHEHLRHIPVIFVTAMDADEDEERGLALGAVDYVTKPVKPALLLARVRAQLELKKARDWLRDQNAFLDAEVRRRMAENELIKDFSLLAMATLAEKRDNETGNHLRRTQAYIEALMERLKNHPRFHDALATEDQRQRIAKAAPLHDIGKVGIPDAILLKPGRLTPDEFEIMKTHAAIGAQAIGEAMQRVQDPPPAADTTGAME
ncbi:MAG: response regulator, partial [Rhodoferax sp.]